MDAIPVPAVLDRWVASVDSDRDALETRLWKHKRNTVVHGYRELFGGEVHR